MASYTARWTSGAAAIDVDLIDAIGPINNYQFSDPNGVIPAQGDCTNQMNRVVPTVGGWVMNGFDNSSDYATDGSVSGLGETLVTFLGSFPQGEFTWVITRKL